MMIYFLVTFERNCVNESPVITEIGFSENPRLDREVNRKFFGGFLVCFFNED